MKEEDQLGGPARRERAISTAVDAVFALLILGIAVGLLTMGVSYGQTQDSDRESTRADHTAETLLSSTVTTEYSIQPVSTEPEFEAGNVGSETAYTRVVHGTPADLLADAAVTNARFDEPSLWDNTGQLTVTGQSYEDALAESVYVRMLPAESKFNMTAVWRPYENSSVLGTASAGDSPPSNKEVHSVTTTVPSGIEPVEPDASRDFDAWGDAIARSIVDGYFPERASNLSLEQRGLERELTVYRYKRIETFLENDVDLGDRTTNGGPLNRSTANSAEANDRLVDALGDRIATELANEYDDPSDVEAGVQASEVEITVRVWDE
ncbi:hypothetical protein EGH22_04605 [Halomicroarcula sp. F28]|uniref:DUF7284 family protein n=1 Tax=Haloarcula salinisoli TaxID=2487746 RepID=UPI001C73C722|nr:hypothetical protein [Halomicroarcula salinisoli]MBX0285595.1 hypothetical protein [Halomicroarcula salinisoli]